MVHQELSICHQATSQSVWASRPWPGAHGCSSAGLPFLFLSIVLGVVVLIAVLCASLTFLQSPDSS